MMGISIKYIVLSIMGVFTLFFSLNTHYLIPTTFAQSANCGGGTVPRAEGLVTAPNLSGKFGTSGACVVDPKTAFFPFRIPTYDDLKSLYYDQSKLPKNTISGNLPSSFGGDGIYQSNGDITVNNSPDGNGTEIIFVKDGNLNINQNIIYHTNDGGGGLVFIVEKDINIAPNVTQIDAVLISAGVIFTAGANCSTSQVTQSSGSPIVALKVNGSLVALNQGNDIRFCRKLRDNKDPAEIINAQGKYLVLLRNLMSDTLQKWSEIDASVITPNIPQLLCSPYNGSASLCSSVNCHYCGSPSLYCVKTQSECPAPPTADILVNNSNGPITIPHNSSANLAWTTTNNPASCSASGDWSGTKPNSGSESTGNLNGPATRNYNLTCSNIAGSTVDSVTINVNTPPPTVDLKANSSDGPVTIGHNFFASLSWTSSYATSGCTASGAWSGAKGTSDSNVSTAVLSGPNTYTYTLTCSNSTGSKSDSVTVNVSAPLLPSVTTQAATGVTATLATLNSSVNPNGSPTDGWYKYNINNYGSNCDSYPDTTANRTSRIALGSGTSPVNNPISIANLTPGTTYYFCALASSGSGIRSGNVMNFTTPAPTPPPCVSNGSCNAPTPACGQTTTGVDNCGKSCTKTGPACGQTFVNPTINGMLVDNCLYWGTQCGQPAANEYCHRQGRNSAINYDLVNQPPTYVMGDNATCPWWFCTGFSQITCDNTPFAAPPPPGNNGGGNDRDD